MYTGTREHGNPSIAGTRAHLCLLLLLLLPLLLLFLPLLLLLVFIVLILFFFLLLLLLVLLFILFLLILLMLLLLLLIFVLLLLILLLGLGEKEAGGHKEAGQMWRLLPGVQKPWQGCQGKQFRGLVGMPGAALLHVGAAQGLG